MKSFWFTPTFSNRAKCITEHLVATGIFTNAKSIFDFGCGRGCLDHELLRHLPHLQITGVDVIDAGKKKFAFSQIDGSIPNLANFASDAFDIVMANFSLHHTIFPVEYFKELVRISSNYVLLIEDTYNNQLEHLFVKGFDVLFNSIDIYLHKVPIPLNHLSVSVWKELFKSSELQLAQEHRLYYYPMAFFPIRYVMYLLEKRT